MGILTHWISGRSQYRNRLRRAETKTRLNVERLEARDLLAANLTAYRPDTDYINYFNYPVAEAVETDIASGPGIRINGDNDGAKENDLVRVDVDIDVSGDLTWTATTLAVWTTANKQPGTDIQPSTLTSDQTLWVEYVGTSHTADADDATVMLSAGGASDTVVFHTFRGDVLAIGGNQQDPWNYVNPDILNNSQLGVYKIAGMLYTQGYDVHLYSHSQVSTATSTIGRGAAYDEVVSAITSRQVTDVAIFGYSWGGGATYNLAKGLKANAMLASIAPNYLKYTAYIDGINRSSFLSIAAERRLPPGTQYHDNYYQRRDWLLKGNSVISTTADPIPAGTTVNNVNVNTRTWGSGLVHTTIDDRFELQVLIVGSLTAKVKR